MPPQDLLNHPTTPSSLEACKLAEPQTVQASPLQRKSNGRELRQVVFRLIRSSAATILTSDLEEQTEPKGTGLAVFVVPVPLPDRHPRCCRVCQRSAGSNDKTGKFYFVEDSGSTLGEYFGRASDGRDGHGGFRHSVICRSFAKPGAVAPFF